MVNTEIRLTVFFAIEDGETMEKVRNFIFLGFKITANGDCSHEIKTLAPWKKAMTNLDCILKSQQRSI